MKRVLLALLAVLVLLLAGCTTVNQTNSFVDLPTAEPVQQTANPDSAQPATMAPNVVPVTTTDMPEQTNIPQAPASTDAPQDTAAPEDSPAPNGLNG